MSKQAISYAALLAKVQGVLANYPEECRNIHIDSLRVYLEQVDGANWNIEGYRRSGDDNDWPGCRERIESEVQNLREHYDVEDQEPVK